MAIVRFADDSDVYCYATGGGYCLIVASYRIDRATLPPPAPAGDKAAELTRAEAVLEIVRAAAQLPLEHARAGSYAETETAEGAAYILGLLKAEGLRVPDRAFERLRAAACLEAK